MTKKEYSREDASLSALLDLDGEIFPMDNGYWTKFEVSRVTPTPQIPHGIRYSLTLHDRNNTRILGFDNAHTFKPKKKKYGARKITWDHKHKMEKVCSYELESASQLLEDFWEAVEKILR
ncbi:MAG: hypothetical protein JRD93_17175 [Deltaproteobacteria bacterium]|nr:hypothetical protein [Deltaproteobacteria bacterium]MBW2663658.1 hypothetical protein [Deltaproteobacteria bacterium]